MMKTLFLFLALPLLAYVVHETSGYPNRVRLPVEVEPQSKSTSLAAPKSYLQPHSELQNSRQKRFIFIALAVTAFVLCKKGVICKQGGGQQAPPKIDGNWGEWYDVGGCSVTCNSGVQQIQRVCDNPPPQHGGAECEGPSRDTRNCFPAPCPINGGWSTWAQQGICKSTTQSTEQLSCGKGVKKSTRTCSKPFPEHGGQGCAGEAVRHDTCSAGICQGCFRPPIPPGVLYYSADANFTEEELAVFEPDTVFRHKDVISFGCDKGLEFEEPPPEGSTFHTLKCDKGEWQGVSPVCNDINECTEDIHGCDPVRSNCTNTYGAFKCYCKPGYEKDALGQCKGVPINGGWGVWVPAGICSKTCGGGVRRYERTCNNPPPKYGGHPCHGDDYKIEPCNTQCCPVHGKWSDWIDGPCSTTCDNGVRKRYRSCEGPYCGGEDCKGIKEIEIACNERPCRGCPIPVPSPGVKFHVTNGTVEFKHEERLSYTCVKGFEFAFNNSAMTFPSIGCNGGIWEGDTPECEDINECELSLHSCNPETSQCLNTEGTYKCFCKRGFKLSSDGKTCEDVDECDDNNGGCKEHCRNDFGTYQCYCPDGYDLDTDGLSCVHPSADCPDLPTPGNGSKSCAKTSYGLRCTLECDEDYEFSGSYDPSPQTCIDGRWGYQEDGVEIPDCEEIGDTFIDFDTFVGDLGDCDPSTEFDTDASDLLDDADGSGTASVSTSCEPTFRKRSTPTLMVKLSFSIRLPRGCRSRTCRNNELRKLYARAYKVRSLINSNRASVTVTNKNTSETRTVPLTGKLLAKRPRLACDAGSVLVKGLCTLCGQGYYYNGALSSAKCDPCPLNTYQDVSGSTSCKRCPTGTYTNMKATKSQTLCLAPCKPGTFSKTGLSPCKPCPVGTYQNASKANFCYYCNFGLVTQKEGATSKDQCGCPNGTFWQNCSKNCICVNGGKCKIDGTCVCPRGWTGPDCSKPDPNSQCQDTYFIKFFNNYRALQKRQLLLLSGPDREADFDVFIGHESNSSFEVNNSVSLNSSNAGNIPIESSLPLVYQVSLYPYDRSSLIGFNGEFASTEAFCGLPVQNLEEGEVEEYRAISTPNSQELLSRYHSTILVIGTQNDTLVEISPTQDAVVTVSFIKDPIELSKGEKVSYTLGKYNTIQISSEQDLTGSKVIAHHPVVVYSGHECGTLPTDKLGCDHMVKQLLPVSALGQCYVVAPFLGRSVDHFIKVVVVEDDTTINVTCRNSEGTVLTESVGPLDDGLFYQHFVPAQAHCYIRSDKPVMVAQFITAQQQDSYGDPSLIILPSTSSDNFVNEVTFYSMDLEDTNDFIHFANVIVPKDYSDPQLILLDGLSLSSYEHNATSLVTECGEFEVYGLQLEAGYHEVHHTSSEGGVMVTVYGYATYASYGYIPGMNQAMSCKKKAKAYYE